MSDSTPPAASAEIPDSWTNPQSDEPYTNTEWESLNEAIHGHDVAVGPVGMRWVASDALIALSVIAEGYPEHPAATLAKRALRKSRERIERKATRKEEAV